MHVWIKHSVMGNFIAELIRPCTLVTGYSRLFSVKVVFWMRLIFKLIDSEESRLLFMVCLGLAQSVEGLTRIRSELLRARRDWASRRPQDLTCSSFLVSGLPGYAANLD